MLEIFFALCLLSLAMSVFLKIFSGKHDAVDADYVILSKREPLFAEDSDFVGENE